MYKQFLSPILDRFDSETWHVRAKNWLHLAEQSTLSLKLLEKLSDRGKRFFDKRLQVNIGGVELENPLLVGAGWDKEGKAVLGLYTLGFAGIEVGSVLAKPQPGNPKPRQFVIGNGVAINRLGFNSPGMKIVAENLKKYKGKNIPIGISLGKNKEVAPKDAPKAHAVVTEKLYPYADYFTINVSSPNTPGLRALQDKKPLTAIVKAVIKAMQKKGGRKPLFVKIAPDMTKEAIDDVIEVALQNNLTGIIATNTTVRSDLKAKYGEKWRNEAGGLSGDDKEFRKMSTQIIAYIYRKAGKKLKIIGVGGVKDIKTALEKILAGATALQIVTAIRSEGTTVPGKINRGLADYLTKKKIKRITDLVGKDAKKYNL